MEKHKENLRIALITDGIWPFVIGGMQKHSFYLCKYFARNGVFVELFHTADSESDIQLDKCFTSEEQKFIRSHFIPRPITDARPGHYVRSSYRYSISVFNELMQIINEGTKIDFIYSKGLAGWETIRQKENIPGRPPVAVKVHGYEYFQKAASFKEKLKQYFLRPAFVTVNTDADYIFSYGGKITDIIKKHIPKSKDKIIEIPTGIEREFLTKDLKPHSKRTFVFIGRNERRKGIFELNKAIRQLKDQDFTFNFIGDIPEESRIHSPNIVYHGVLKDREAITSIMQSSDVLVCPSYAEGMPNVILEGMASGCAIIASDVGAVNIQVDKSNGWLIEPGSVKNMYQTLTSAIDLEAGNLHKMRENSHRKVKEFFLWENVIKMKIDAIKKIIQ